MWHLWQGELYGQVKFNIAEPVTEHAGGADEVSHHSPWASFRLLLKSAGCKHDPVHLEWKVTCVQTQC